MYINLPAPTELVFSRFTSSTRFPYRFSNFSFAMLFFPSSVQLALATAFLAASQIPTADAFGRVARRQPDFPQMEPRNMGIFPRAGDSASESIEVIVGTGGAPYSTGQMFTYKYPGTAAATGAANPTDPALMSELSVLNQIMATESAGPDTEPTGPVTETITANTTFTASSFLTQSTAIL